jgi:hypothetical protein
VTVQANQEGLKFNGTDQLWDCADNDNLSGYDIVGSKSFHADQHFKVTEMKQRWYFSIQSPFISTHLTSVN